MVGAAREPMVPGRNTAVCHAFSISRPLQERRLTSSMACCWPCEAAFIAPRAAYEATGP